MYTQLPTSSITSNWCHTFFILGDRPRRGMALALTPCLPFVSRLAHYLQFSPADLPSNLSHFAASRTKTEVWMLLDSIWNSLASCQSVHGFKVTVVAVLHGLKRWSWRSGRDSKHSIWILVEMADLTVKGEVSRKLSQSELKMQSTTPWYEIKDRKG